MITPLSVYAQALTNKGYKIKIKNDEVRITKNGKVDDVKINCVYTKKEIDELLQNILNSGNPISYIFTSHRRSRRPTNTT